MDSNAVASAEPSASPAVRELLQRAAHCADRHETVAREADDLAAILYTSGTTGRSKGAMLTHGNLLSNAQVLKDYWGWKPGDVLVHALPIFHVHGLFVGERTDSDFVVLDPPIVRSDAYAVWSVGARVRATPRLEIFGRVENLTDADYMEPLGFLAWRRTAHAGLRVGF